MQLIGRMRIKRNFTLGVLLSLLTTCSDLRERFVSLGLLLRTDLVLIFFVFVLLFVWVAIPFTFKVSDCILENLLGQTLIALVRCFIVRSLTLVCVIRLLLNRRKTFVLDPVTQWMLFLLFLDGSTWLSSHRLNQFCLLLLRLLLINAFTSLYQTVFVLMCDLLGV